MFTIQTDSTDCGRLRFSPGNRYLLLGDGCEVWMLTPGPEAIYSDVAPCGVEWHPKKAELYVPQQFGKLEIIAPTGKVLQTLPKAGWVQGMCFSPAGDWLVTFSPFDLIGRKRVRDRWQKKWSVEINPKSRAKKQDSFESVAPFPDGRRILTLITRRELPNHEYTGLFVARDLATGAVLTERAIPPEEGPLGVRTRLSITPDGSTVIGFRARSVYAWPTDGAAKPRRATVSKKDVQDVALHPSGRWVLVAGNTPEVTVWDTTTWKSVRSYDWGIGPVHSVGVSPDGALAAAGNEGGKVVVWDWDL